MKPIETDGFSYLRGQLDKRVAEIAEGSAAQSRCQWIALGIVEQFMKEGRVYAFMAMVMIGEVKRSSLYALRPTGEDSDFIPFSDDFLIEPRLPLSCLELN